MKRNLLHIILAVGLGMSVAGCAVYPAVQVAGGAMTGYDAVIFADKHIPRESVEGGQIRCDSDAMLERRLRERLRLGGVHTVSAHVINGHAYLVGQTDSRAQADQALGTARTLEGVRLITCKFYPRLSEREARSDAALLRTVSQKLAATKRLESADLRIEVIGGTAILIGSTSDHSQKTAALAIAGEVWGVRDVVDYIAVEPVAQAGTENSRVARY